MDFKNDTSLSSSSVGYSTDDEDSSTTSRHRKHVKRFPSKASDWTPDHMKELRVKYDESATDLKQFMSGLKQQRDIEFFGLSEMPAISYELLQFTKDSWTFSFDFDFDKDAGLGEGMNRARESILELDLKKSDMEKEVQEMDEKYRSLFCGWRLSLLEFWKYFSTLLARFGKPRQREGRFTQLFMAFSKIFFLTPETGEAYSECLVIKDIAVLGIPNVRFMTFPYFPPAEKILKLIIVTEVKHDAFRGQYNSETFTFKNISKRVLGQHGIKLLMEREGSFFYPYVVGLLCIGTKIIFTCLHIDEAHFQRITSRGEVDETMESTISYTRPFDYMDVNDREEIMESFFWFGFLQSNAYRFI